VVSLCVVYMGSEGCQFCPCRAVFSSELQERCLARVGSRAPFIGGLDAPQVDAAIHDACVMHPARGSIAGSRAGPGAAPGMVGYRGRDLALLHIQATPNRPEWP
jgi:hypothetical protein